MTPIISRGFRGRRRDDAPPDRVPPGQYLTGDFPVLLAGPTPHTPLDEWDFTIVGEVDELHRWNWEEFRALPSEEVTVDIHCVTKWSKLDTTWQGVRVDTLLDGVETAAEYVVAFCDGGYTTNLPLEDVHRREGVGRLLVRRRAARPGARGACAAPRPAPVLLEEREVGAGPPIGRDRRARLLGTERLPPLRRPLAGTAVLGRLTWLPVEAVEVVPRRRASDASSRRSRLARPPARAARRRPADGRGRLPGTAQLLDRLPARRDATQADGRADRGRRGLALPRRRAAGR